MLDSIILLWLLRSKGGQIASFAWSWDRPSVLERGITVSDRYFVVGCTGFSPNCHLSVVVCVLLHCELQRFFIEELVYVFGSTIKRG